jgi:hypothetical protein
MATLTVYDPALCCSTGVCGPDVDEALVRFAADVEWLKRQGVEVRRYNLGQEPGAFAASAVVRGALMREGVDCLPLLLLGEEVVASGVYPERAELAALAGRALAEVSAEPKAARGAGLAIAGCAPGSGCC